MRFMRFTRLAAAGTCLLLAAACLDDDLTGLNENPNAPTEVQPQFLFPQGVTTAVQLVRGSDFDLTFTGLWAQYFAKVQYVDEDWYEIRPTTVDFYWSSFYAGPLADLQAVIEEASDQPGLVGPALVMRAWTVGAMTDIWGDIPFTEALQGREGVTTPAYDPQEVVYDSLFASLAEAAELLPGDVSFGTADPLYGGDNARWERFANSLRARYGMRLSEVDEDRARDEVQAALAAGVFQSNDDNAVIVWPGDGQNDHPFFTNFKTRDDHRVSKAIVDTMAALDDPRLAVYARPAAATDRIVGLPNGLSLADAAGYLGNGISQTSRIGTFFSEATSPSYLMTYAEVLFIHAEAAARGWVAGDAASLYRQAITASMQQFGITDPAAISAYLAQPRVAYSSANGLSRIALQKWIALYGQGLEGWAEYRRTGVPNLRAGPDAKTVGNVVARRLEYPGSEQSFNAANLAAAVTRQGDVSTTGRVWWDR